METTEKSEGSEAEIYPDSVAIGYGFAFFADVTVVQLVSFLLFTFYYIIIGIDILWITIATIIWSLWNAINDPLMGAISDKTNTKYGKRRPWIILGIFPSALILILVWLPPAGPDVVVFIYLIIMLMLFDTFYTMYSLNQTALFPEMFQSLEQRARANNIVQIIGIVALLFAFVLPGLIIPEYTNPKYKANYVMAGIVMAVVSCIAATIFIKFGLKERAEFKQDSEIAPGFIESLKTSIKNKSFLTYVIANLSIFYVLGMLTSLAPIYSAVVLGITNGLLISLLLMCAFLSAAAFMILWNKISVKYGVKKGQMAAMCSFIVCLIPFLFVNNFIGGLFAFILAGIGLAGALFFRTVTMSAIIDEDELNTGVRREGGYFGINALFIRLSTIFTILSTAIVLYMVDRSTWDPNDITLEVIIGIKVLFVVLPAIAIGIGLLSMSQFPITKERYEEVKAGLEKLHEEKKQKMRG